MHKFCFSAVLLIALVSGIHSTAQISTSHEPVALLSAADSPAGGDRLVAGTDNLRAASPAVPLAFRSDPFKVPEPMTTRPFSTVGLDAHIGIGGFGFDVATPATRTLNIRTGADFFGYGTSFQEEGATVNAHLQLRSAHVSADWFPFAGHFRISPLLIFGNNNRSDASTLVPGGSTINLSGANYVSSPTDPLHGSGSISFRKVAPGVSVGFGNIIPRTSSRFSIPVEAGFYYVGQPSLKVNFSGSACDPTVPTTIGCQPVSQDPAFQRDLDGFIARNNHNLSYASFFPILSIGFGYRF